MWYMLILHTSVVYEEKASKEQRQNLRITKAKEKEMEAKKVCEETMKELHKNGPTHIEKLTVQVLKDLIQYVFKSDEYKKDKIRKPELRAITRSHYEAYCAANKQPYSAEDEAENMLENSSAEILEEEKDADTSSGIDDEHDVCNFVSI